MKILYVITSLRTGGAEKLMLDLLPRLQKAGIDVELCVFDGTETPFKKEFLATGIPLIEFSKGRNVYSPINIFSLIKLLRKNNYDIVHTHNTAPQLFGAISSVLCSVVLCTTEHTTSNRRRGSMWYGLIDRWMYGRYSKIICISEKTEKNLRDSLSHFSPKTQTILNGIDTVKYSDAFAGGIDKIKDNCEIAIIQVAGFRYQKDQKTVIRAMTFLPQSVHLYFAGDGELMDECRNLAIECEVDKRVHFLGVRTDIPQLLKSSDIVVMSSHWEGFGLAAAEGMAARKPVIASDADGLREVVKDAGLLFEKGNERELAEKILRLIGDKQYYNNVAEKCYRRAEKFDISNMVEGYKRVYEYLVKNSDR